MKINLDADIIKSKLYSVGSPTIRIFDQLESTNTYCMNNKLAPFNIIIAKQQSKGRGQRGHSFYSPDQGLYLSIVLPVTSRFLVIPGLLTLGIGISIVRAITVLTNKTVKLKWINDIMYHNKKTGGILVETQHDKQGNITNFIIGIGINLKVKRFPKNIQVKTTNLLLDNETIDLNALVANIYNSLLIMYYGINNASIIKTYNYECIWTNKKVKLLSKDNKKLMAGKIKGVDRVGNLLLEEKGKLYRLNSNQAAYIYSEV